MRVLPVEKLGRHIGKFVEGIEPLTKTAYGLDAFPRLESAETRAKLGAGANQKAT